MTMLTKNHERGLALLLKAPGNSLRERILLTCLPVEVLLEAAGGGNIELAWKVVGCLLRTGQGALLRDIHFRDMKLERYVCGKLGHDFDDNDHCRNCLLDGTSPNEGKYRQFGCGPSGHVLDENCRCRYCSWSYHDVRSSPTGVDGGKGTVFCARCHAVWRDATEIIENVECGSCGGRGSYLVEYSASGSSIENVETCSSCGGSGRTEEHKRKPGYWDIDYASH